MCEVQLFVGNFSLKLLDGFLKLFSFAALLPSHFCDDCVLFMMVAILSEEGLALIMYRML
jgi:hypothetical protein